MSGACSRPTRHGGPKVRDAGTTVAAGRIASTRWASSSCTRRWARRRVGELHPVQPDDGGRRRADARPAVDRHAAARDGAGPAAVGGRDGLRDRATSMCVETIGPEGRKFFPFVFTLFFFILFGNLLGVFPLFFTFTSHIAVTLALTAVRVRAGDRGRRSGSTGCTSSAISCRRACRWRWCRCWCRSR